MKNLRFRKLMAMLSLFAASGILARTGYAQASTTTTATPTTTEVTAPASEEPTKMEQYVVTGSNIPQAAEAAALPIVTVDASVMQESGVNSDLLDILRKVAPNISGVGSEAAQIQTGNNFGGASVNIKGLPTLVLINGRRVANDPSEAGEGGPEFVDLNLIPPAMVDRIEVLQDGASAIYGSDAVGGVINIILKKDYNGWETGVHYGYNTDTGHYTERSGYLVGGVSNDKTSITIGVDYAQHTDLFLADRPYTNPIYGTYTFPGSLEVYNNITGNDQFYRLAPGINAPPGGANSTIQQLVANGTYVPEATADQFQGDGRSIPGLQPGQRRDADRRLEALQRFDQRGAQDLWRQLGGVCRHHRVAHLHQFPTQRPAERPVPGGPMDRHQRPGLSVVPPSRRHGLYSRYGSDQSILPEFPGSGPGDSRVGSRVRKRQRL
jgi:outer membrane receptor protein involved in Fe transport